MKAEFADLVAVVTGAAQGIGRAIAEELRARGARLILIDRNADRVAATAEALRGTTVDEVSFLVVDLADPAAIAALTAEVGKLEPKVDVLINNAGIELDMPFTEITAAQFDCVIAVNLRAPLLMTQAMAPLFPATGGAIVNISSIHADHAFPNSVAYACSKAGMIAANPQPRA